MRVGIGYLIQETNTFSPVKSKVEDFKLAFADEAIRQWKGTKTEIGGFLEVLAETGLDVEVLFAGWALPAGSLEMGEFERMKSVIVEKVSKAGRLDALLLALHGAMCAEGTGDCGGVLLRNIRELLGREIPIVLTLDLHANITRQIIDNVDGVIGYKTYPHVDMYETGRTAAMMLNRILQGEIRLVTAMQKIPLIVPAENMQTTAGPMAEVFAAGEVIRAKHPEILCVSAFGVQPWLDIEEMGCATVVVADRNASTAKQCTLRMAQRFWELKQKFEVKLFSPRDAVQAAVATDGKPVVLAEPSDNPTAGSPGDSAELLQAILDEAPDVPSAVWLRDQPAVARAWELRPGARLKTDVGGTIDSKSRRPVPIDGLIRSLSDGNFTLKGTWNTGMQAHMGRTAVIEVAQMSIVLSEDATIMIDPEVYRSQGIEPREKKIVVVKSANGFRSEYQPFAQRMILVDTPGISSPNLSAIPYRRVSRPIYPLDPIEFSPEVER